MTPKELEISGKAYLVYLILFGGIMSGLLLLVLASWALVAWVIS